MDRLVGSDEELAQRTARMRHIDELVRAAVPQEETVPHALVERLGLAGSAVEQNVVSLAEARTARDAARARPAPRGWGGMHGFRRMAAQLLLVGGIGVALAVWAGGRTDTNDAPYRALSDAPAASDAAAPVNGLVLFETGTSPQEAQRIVAAAGGRIVGAPTEAGAFKLAIVPERRDAVLQALSGHDGVVMAEAIDGSRP